MMQRYRTLFLGILAASLPCVAVSAADVFYQAPTVEKSQTIGKSKTTKKTTVTLDDEYSRGPKPMWIWGGKAGDKDRYVFVKEFTTRSRRARMIATCDNGMTVTLNGKVVATSSNWEHPVKVDVSSALKPGKNVLRVKGSNAGGAAGLALKLILRQGRRRPQFVVTDKSWRVSKAGGKIPKESKPAVTLGRMGVKPWGDVFAAAKVSLPSIPRGVFQTRPGFKVELIYTVPKAAQGSWVSLTKDDKGRLIASDQGRKGLFRITPAPIGSDKKSKVELLTTKMYGCQGMLHAFGSLYCSVNGGPGSGFYKLTDTNGDDSYDKIEKLKAFQGGGEHGPHALRLSPDGKSIYVIAGNHTNPPKDFDKSRLPSNWGEDLLLPRQWDARGHARGKLAPGGWIAKTDPNGKTWEIVSSGYRNPYDFAFNADGEIFAYDADMEWDMGSPWYRPTRVVHATSGSEFGWRSGTGKWPTYYIDSLPPLVDIGPGSPVGVEFGYGAKFPAKYQKALFILDWTFGTIYAIHSEAEGSTYSAVKEEFLSRKPLPLTDAVVGNDGALYFTAGGRGTDSALYRVTYVGKESTKPVDAKSEEFAALRKVRRDLEALHTKGVSSNKLDFIWKNLSHKDRFIRYAARVALEHQPKQRWYSRALSEKNPTAFTQAMVAFARQVGKAGQPAAIQAMTKFDFANRHHHDQLGLLRAYALVFIRLGKPTALQQQAILKQLDQHYPAKMPKFAIDRTMKRRQVDELNRELCRVLVYLNSPTVITKTLKLMKQPDTRKPEDIAKLLARSDRYGPTIAKMLANLPEMQNTHYAFMLRNMRYGWTLEQRREYFKYLSKAATRSGGASYTGFINNMRKDALANVSDAEKKLLASSIAPPPVKKATLPKPIGPGKDWTLEDILAASKGGLSGRDFKAGKRAYAAAKCIVCHRFDGEGGATGPDLTNLSGRFSVKDMAEAIVNPSKVISDQYRAHIIVTKGGKTYTGRIASEDGGVVTVLTDPEDGTKVAKIPAGEVDIKKASKVSIMPKDLLKQLNKQEVLNLIAYLMSRGNPNDLMFRKR